MNKPVISIEYQLIPDAIADGSIDTLKTSMRMSIQEGSAIVVYSDMAPPRTFSDEASLMAYVEGVEEAIAKQRAQLS